MSLSGVRAFPVLSILVTGSMLCVAGCRDSQEPIPSGSFRVVVDDVIVDDLVLVKRITITAAGRRSVGVSEKGGLDQLWGDPDPRTGLMTAHVVFLADLVKLQPASENLLRWMVRMTSGGGTVGGPGLSAAGSAQSLREVLSLNLSSGTYPLSREISLGHIQGRELALRVQ